MLRAGDDLLVIAAGPMAHAAMSAAVQLAEKEILCTVINARFVKPLDTETLVPAISAAKSVITVEESCLCGGFGSAILELCEKHGLRPRVRRLGVPDLWIPQATVASQLRTCELTAEHIVTAYSALAGDHRLVSVA
jgi:1-deoxy-D-xylulose-5-phosphate synthase